MLAACLTAFADCGGNSGREDNSAPSVRTPVTITRAAFGPMTERMDLRAVSSFLLKTAVKSPTDGYVESVHGTLGQYVEPGHVLLVVRTKEAESLQRASRAVDSVFGFRGLVPVSAPGGGYIVQWNTRTGEYVQDGESLAVLGDPRSLVFLLDVPYELSPLFRVRHTVDVHLPDGRTLSGRVGMPLPFVDASSQSQTFRVSVENPVGIPEGLIARVSVVRQSSGKTVSVPREAVLTDEVENAWWIVKLLDDSTAIRVPVRIGMQTDERIEILAPPLTSEDKIVLSGNFGLPDTARVTVPR
jgi:multidrug efflux pump subunit AcrA (membrane-fusion protein)